MFLVKVQVIRVNMRPKKSQINSMFNYSNLWLLKSITMATVEGTTGTL